MSTAKAKIVPNRKEFKFPQNGKLVVGADLLGMIQWLHIQVGNVEWSGVLVYEIISGEHADEKDFVLKAHGLYLMDIGTSAYTEYEFDENIMEMYDEYPGLTEKGWKIGHIHTHHNMATFFSGTDMAELHDNSPNHNFYLSLIVNYKDGGDYAAKVSYIGRRKSEIKEDITYPGFDGSMKPFSSDASGEIEEEILITRDMDIVYEGVSHLLDQHEKIKEAKKTRYTRPAYGSGGAGTNVPGFRPRIGSGSQGTLFREEKEEQEAEGYYATSESEEPQILDWQHQEFKSFLSKWISMDATSETELKAALKEAQETYAEDKMFGLYYDNLQSGLENFYILTTGETCPSDKTLIDLCEGCVRVLKLDYYNELEITQELIKMLELYPSEENLVPDDGDEDENEFFNPGMIRVPNF